MSAGANRQSASSAPGRDSLTRLAFGELSLPGPGRERPPPPFANVSVARPVFA